MVLEVAALVVAIINAIIAGQPVFSKLWEKIKNFFGGSSKIPIFPSPGAFAEGFFSPRETTKGLATTSHRSTSPTAIAARCPIVQRYGSILSPGKREPEQPMGNLGTRR
jgi:hypothetical protein